jgi:ribonucleoside-diphosphate reductase alpha chain
MTSSNIYVLKGTGKMELLDLEKIHNVLTWAARGLNVSVSLVEIRAQLQFVDGMSTAAINQNRSRSN